MIVLIDDTSLESVNATFLLEKKYVNILHIIRTPEELEDYRTNLSSADCILIHRTFSGSNIYKEQMTEFTHDGEKIPLVVFSAGDSEHAVYNENSSHIIDGLKKAIFYARIYAFIESYMYKHSVDLRILAYGKDFNKIKVRSLALSVLRIVEGKQGDMTIQDLANIAACPDFKELISISNPELGLTYDELLENLEDKPISFNIFRNKINQIVNSFYQYGRNIYLWQ